MLIKALDAWGAWTLSPVCVANYTCSYFDSGEPTAITTEGYSNTLDFLFLEPLWFSSGGWRLVYRVQAMPMIDVALCWAVECTMTLTLCLVWLHTMWKFICVLSGCLAAHQKYTALSCLSFSVWLCLIEHQKYTTLFCVYSIILVIWLIRNVQHWSLLVTFPLVL